MYVHTHTHTHTHTHARTNSEALYQLKRSKPAYSTPVSDNYNDSFSDSGTVLTPGSASFTLRVRCRGKVYKYTVQMVGTLSYMLHCCTCYMEACHSHSLPALSPGSMVQGTRESHKSFFCQKKKVVIWSLMWPRHEALFWSPFRIVLPLF